MLSGVEGSQLAATAHAASFAARSSSATAVTQ
jgi:hypothetical protein